jgi:protein SCO1
MSTATKDVLRWGLIALTAIVVGVIVNRELHKPATLQIESGTLLDRPRPVAEFNLQGADGKPFTRADLAGHTTVIFVGYTFCPDVCPQTLTELKAVHAKLGDLGDKLRFVFLSIDPERDTPEKLASYVHYFSPDFSAATGTNPELDKLGENLGYAYTKVPGGTPESYQMDHSAALIVIGPQTQLLGYLTPPFKVDAMSQDLRALVDHAG